MSSSCDNLQEALRLSCITVNQTVLACCQLWAHISNGLFWIFSVLTKPCLAHSNVQAHWSCCTVGEGNSSNPLKQVLNAIEETVECATYDRVSKMHFAWFCTEITCSRVLSCSVMNPPWKLLVTCRSQHHNFLLMWQSDNIQCWGRICLKPSPLQGSSAAVLVHVLSPKDSASNNLPCCKLCNTNINL